MRPSHGACERYSISARLEIGTDSIYFSGFYFRHEQKSKEQRNSPSDEP